MSVIQSNPSSQWCCPSSNYQNNGDGLEPDTHTHTLDHSPQTHTTAAAAVAITHNNAPCQAETDEGRGHRSSRAA